MQKIQNFMYYCKIDHREKIRKSTKSLSLTSKWLAQEMDGLSPGALSRFLSGDDSALSHSRHIEIIAALERGLEELSQICSDFHSAKSEHKEQEILSGASRRFGPRLGRRLRNLTRNKVETELRLIQSLLYERGAGHDDHIVPPYGPLPYYAVNYIQRNGDKQFLRYFGFNGAPSVVATAPINGGLSSFLDRIAAHVRSHTDITMCIIRMSEAAQEIPGEYSARDIFLHILKELKLPKDITSNMELNSTELQGEFWDWARIAWKESSRSVLIIDGIDEVLKSARSDIEFDSLFSWMRILRQKTSPPFDKNTLVIGFSGATFTSFKGSPIWTQSMKITLDKLNPDQTVKLFELLGIKLSPEEAAEVFSLFAGHPFLTHLFAFSMHLGASFIDAVKASLSSDSEFKEHWSRVRADVLHLCGNEEHLEEMFSFVRSIGNAGGVSIKHLRDFNFAICRDYLADILAYGLVDQTEEEFSVCEYYLAAVKRELSTKKKVD